MFIPAIKDYFLFGKRKGENRWRDDLTTEELQELWDIMQNDERISGILTAAQVVKNASLGKLPDEMAETLKLQVNLGIGGLLAMIQRNQAVMDSLFLILGITPEQLAAAYQAAPLAPLNTTIAKGLIYWQWIAQVDAEAQAAIAENREPNFPNPPTL